ncbi:MAG TPA: DUF1552 domain-containing protein [Labilithrix sp.]|nr:DUF1552 domain-containing protein [Labilithrix sp.]
MSFFGRTPRTNKTFLSRRALLKGIGGAAIALPTLEIMLNSSGTALADGPAIAKRFFVGLIGQALSGDNAPTNLYVPSTVGPNYDLKAALAPLVNVKQHVSVVSGMEILAAGANGGVVPAGGRMNDFHCGGVSPLLCGVKSDTSAAARCYGITSDQVVANAIGTTTVKSLVLECPVDFYVPGYTAAGREYMSYSAANKPIPASISPRQTFTSLFGNFTTPGPVTDPDADFQRRSRRSVLDLVAGNTEQLMKRLGKVDQERMAAHLAQIRDLEKRIDALPPVQTQTCKKPADPGADPTVGIGAKYSGERERAKVFGDLVHMAFTCDLTRSVSLMYSMFQSHMAASPVTNGKYGDDLHELGHSNPSAESVAAGMVWQVEAFAALVQNLQNTAEGAGNVLDNSVLVLLNEAGHGRDYSVTPVKNNQTHSTENMACLIAGRAGGLKPGKHVVTQKAHPARVLISAMNAVGVTGSTLGEVSGTVPELFT